MTDQHHEHPLPAAAGSAPASLPQTLDANGFDPAEFEWRPVPRRPRADGWTPDVQRAFIEALARTGVVERACLEVDRSVRSAYALRNAPGGESFARAWTAACRGAADRLLDIAFARAIDGEEVPVHDQDGIRTGVRFRFNTRLTMFLLRAYHPERFGPAGGEGAGSGTRAARPAPASVPAPTAALAAPAPSLANAIAALAPVTPAAPHRLVPPAVLGAQIAAARREASAPMAQPADRTEDVQPRAPATHPRVLDRAARRRAQRQEAEEREARRLRRLGYGDLP